MAHGTSCSSGNGCSDQAKERVLKSGLYHFSRGLAVDNPDSHNDIVVRPLDRDLYDSFDRLVARVWEQTWPVDVHREITQWRYHQQPAGHITWVACVNGECVAMLDSRVRPYLLYNRRVMIRETADWYAMPEHRRYGLGLTMLSKLRSYPEPVLVIGGSNMTRGILGRLRWRELPQVQSYVLPVTARGLTANMLRLKRPQHESLARLVWHRLPCRAPRLLPAPPGLADVQLLTGHEWHPLPVDASSNLVGLMEQDHWEWLARMPACFATQLGMVFRLDGAVVGFCLAQLEPSATGLDGRIVHLQAGQSDVRTLGWIVSSAARALADRGAAFIRCYVSTQEKIAAMKAAGFFLSKPVPCYWWARPGYEVPATVDVDYLRGDDAQPLGALRGRYREPAITQDAA